MEVQYSPNGLPSYDGVTGRPMPVPLETDVNGRLLLGTSIGIRAVTGRFPNERIPEISAKVRAVADELSRLMGYADHRQ